MNQRDDDKPKKAKWKNEIRYWLGRIKSGEWIGESVATTLERTFERHTKGKGHTKAKPVIVKVQITELVHIHGGYRPNFEGEKSTRKAFFFRGARIWRKGQ